MKSSIWILLATCLLFSGHTRADAALERTLFASLLFSEDGETSRLGSYAVRTTYRSDQELTDVLAEALVLSAQPNLDRDHLYAFDHRANTIADLRNGRYRTALLQAKERINDADWLKQIDASVAKLAPEAQQYVPGTLDLAVKRQELEVRLSNAKKADRRAFKEVKSEETLSTVLDRLGSPDVVTGITSYGKWGRVATLVAHYEDTGLIAFRFESKMDRWIVFETADELIPVTQLYSGKLRGLAQMVSSFRGVSFRNVVKFYNRPMRTDFAFLELLAERAMLNKYVPDRMEEDGMAVAVNLVNLGPSPRTDVLLESISKTSGSKEARSDAASYLKRRQGIARQAAAKETSTP